MTQGNDFREKCGVYDDSQPRNALFLVVALNCTRIVFHLFSGLIFENICLPFFENLQKHVISRVWSRCIFEIPKKSVDSWEMCTSMSHRGWYAAATARPALADFRNTHLDHFRCYYINACVAYNPHSQPLCVLRRTTKKPSPSRSSGIMCLDSQLLIRTKKTCTSPSRRKSLSSISKSETSTGSTLMATRAWSKAPMIYSLLVKTTRL